MVARLKITLCCILLAALAAACSHNRAQPSELPLFPEAITEKYWLLNQVSTDALGQMQHDCMLLTLSPSAQTPSRPTAVFLSRWSDRDSIYRFGMQAQPDAVWGKPGRWPLMTRLAGDSTQANWRVFLNRRSFWLDGQFQWPALQQVELRGAFPRQDSLRMAQVHASPDVYALGMGAGRMREGKEPARTTRLQGAVFCDAASLLQDPATQAVYWVQLSDTLGGQSAMLMQLDQTDRLVQLATYTYRPQSGWRAISDENGSFSVAAPWISPHSKKRYCLRLQYHACYLAYHIRPKAQAQEVQAGKRSFWMGAVEVAQDGDDMPLGSGNMYIFHR